MLARAADATEILALQIGDRAADAHLEQIHVARHRVERCAQLVRHRREKERLGRIGRLGIPPRQLLALEQLLALSYVVAHAEEADGLSILIRAEACEPFEPSHGAVRPQESILDVIRRRPLGQRVRDLARNALAIVGVDVRPEFLARSRERSLGKAVHALRLR